MVNIWWDREIRVSFKQLMCMLEKVCEPHSSHHHQKLTTVRSSVRGFWTLPAVSYSNSGSHRIPAEAQQKITTRMVQQNSPKLHMEVNLLHTGFGLRKSTFFSGPIRVQTSTQRCCRMIEESWNSSVRKHGAKSLKSLFVCLFVWSYLPAKLRIRPFTFN